MTILNMKNISCGIIFATVLMTACSNIREQCFYEIDMEYVSDESFKNQFVLIHDTNEIKLLNSILNKECSNLESCPDVEYYYHAEFNEEPRIVIMIDDYYVREYALWGDNMHVELSFYGGDGPYHSRGYSYISNDSLITYVIETEYSTDEYVDTTISNEYTIDTTRHATYIKRKTLPYFVTKCN